MKATVQCKVELLRPHESRSTISAACTSTSASVCCSPPWRLTHGHAPQLRLPASRHVVRAAAAAPAKVDIDGWVEESRRSREQWLEESALGALRTAVEAFERPAFPCALIAGDVVILNLLHRLGYLESGRVPIIFIDTFHLFPETHAFLHRLEEKYGFKAHVFQAAGFTNVAEFKKVHGSDLFIRDIEEYDRICKVEPFQRSLQELRVDVMINGRRRDHGFERAQLEVFEEGSPVKVNPLAWWEFKDCMQYLERNGLERHPLHDQGYPSIGDVQSTVPVPVEKWYEYAGERSGRFQGLQNPDGSLKTECGIHMAEDVKGPASDSPKGAPCTATPNNPPTNSGSQPTTPPSKGSRPRKRHSPIQGLVREFFREWLRAKTAILPGSCVTTLEGCYDSYCTRVRGVFSAVPLSRPEFSAALRAALAAEAARGRLAFTTVARQSAVRGLHVDGVTVEAEALVEEWFHAKAAFDTDGRWVALAACFESFRDFSLPWQGVDGERWAAVARIGKSGFFRLFRTCLADAEAAGRVRYTANRLAVKGLMLL